MSTDFDFNINNYTIPDIENFLGLNQSYTFNDVMKRKQNMITVIIDNKQYDKTYRKKLVDFMEESVVKVIDNIKKTVQQEGDFIEDYDKTRQAENLQGVDIGFFILKKSTNL